MKWSDFLKSPAGKRWHDVAYWGIMLAACAVFYWMNVLTPFKEDDMDFALVGSKPLLDVLRFPIDNIMTSDARFSDIMAVLFCGFLGKSLFNIVNTLVFALMCHLLSLLCTGGRSVMVLALFLALVGCCFPVPGQTMLFVAGSFNYMWAITASLLLIWYLQRAHDARLSRGKATLLFIAAAIAGNFNEATSFGVLAGLCVYYAFDRKALSHAARVALAGYLLGVLIIALSPGAWNRAADGGIVTDLSLTDLLYSRCYIFLTKMWRFVTPLAAVLVGIMALLMGFRRDVKRCVWTYVLPCLAAIMLALGLLNERPYAPLATVGFIIVAMALYYLLKRRPLLRLAITVIALIAGVYTSARALRSLHDYKLYEDKIKRELAASPRQAILREQRFDDNSRFVTPLRYVSSEYFVRENIYCAFYDKDNVQFVSDSVYDRYHSGRLLDGAAAMPWTSDRPDIVDSLLSFPDQDYMVAVMHVDSMPFTSQQARYYHADDGHQVLDENDQAVRRKYGLTTEYTPCGFYPLRYQERLLLVFPLVEDGISHVVFPFDEQDTPTEVTLTRLPDAHTTDPHLSK